MAISYIQTPQLWTPINNDMIYYVQTNSVISVLYLEIHVQSTMIGRVKLVVNDEGFAYCDVKQFLYSFIKNEQMFFEYDVFWNALNDLSYYVNYQIKCFETIGGTAYNDSVKYAFNGQVSFVDFVEYNQPEFTTTDLDTKFLTSSPRILTSDYDRTNFLSYINGTEPATKVLVKLYESNASIPTAVYEFAIPDLTALAGIIAISKEAFGSDFIYWEDVSEAWETVASTWETLGGYLINPYVTAIEITLIDDEGTEVSETFRFNYDSYCSKYEKTNVYWQNSLGGFDSYTFNLVKRNRYDIERKNIQSYPYNFTNVGYSQHTNNVFNLSNQNYFSNYTEGVILNSRLLSDEEHEWFFELIKAHSIYVEQKINNVTYYVPATIKDTTYQPKQHKVDGLQNVQIELQYSYDNIKITK
jgi:hypothetical protein